MTKWCAVHTPHLKRLTRAECMDSLPKCREENAGGRAIHFGGQLGTTLAQAYPLAIPFLG